MRLSHITRCLSKALISIASIPTLVGTIGGAIFIIGSLPSTSEAGARLAWSRDLGVYPYYQQRGGVTIPDGYGGLYISACLQLTDESDPDIFTKHFNAKGEEDWFRQYDGADFPGCDTLCEYNTGDPYDRLVSGGGVDLNGDLYLAGNTWSGDSIWCDAKVLVLKFDRESGAQSSSLWGRTPDDPNDWNRTEEARNTATDIFGVVYVSVFHTNMEPVSAVALFGSGGGLLDLGVGYRLMVADRQGGVYTSANGVNSYDPVCFVRLRNGIQWTGGFGVTNDDHVGHLYAADKNFAYYLVQKSSGDTYLFALTSNGQLQYQTQTSQGVSQVCGDSKGNAYAAMNVAYANLLIKYDSTGHEAWRKTLPVVGFDVDQRGNLYVGTPDSLMRFESDGDRKWSIRAGGAPKLDPKGNIFIGSTKYVQDKTLIFRSAEGDTLPNQWFDLIKVHNDPPYFTEDTLGVIVSDSVGEFTLQQLAVDTFLFKEDELDTETDTLVVGDTLKVAHRVASESSVRHPGIAGTMYSVHLDNADIDDAGAITWDTLDENCDQDFVLEHTEYRYNLLVSVEWDAEAGYLSGLQAEFRYLSNYLYDVSDGQMRLDTVMICDDKLNWGGADVRILASNSFKPKAGIGAGYDVTFDPVRMPRKWYGDVDASRVSSYVDHPLSQAMAANYCTITHELGHYAFGFFDEYRFADPSGSPLPDNVRCRAHPDGNYGFMDYQYDVGGGGAYASEMSSEYRYSQAECQNTVQWVLNGSLSCWDYLESWAERTINDFHVPIRKPHHSDSLEHVTSEGLDYLPGPNDVLEMPDYDVGNLLQFSEPVVGPAITGRSLHLLVDGVPAGGVNVILRKSLPEGKIRDVDQGYTTDLGLMYLLGADPLSDVILASGHSYRVTRPPAFAQALQEPHRGWLYGQVQLGGGSGRAAAPVSAWTSGDSVEMTLNEVVGEFPLIVAAELDAAGWRYLLSTERSFPQTPTLDILLEDGDEFSTAFALSGGGYEVNLPDTLLRSAGARIWAVDDSARSFFVNTAYEAIAVDSSNQLVRIMGPGNQVEVQIDTANAGLEQVLLLASSYPVPMTGLETDAIQGGMAHSLAMYPSISLSGSNWLGISYSESDLKIGDSLIGDETLLKMYRWNESGNTWNYIGGRVDTSGNEVTAEMSAPGTYALFTTKSPVGVEDEPESSPPYRFELSQNYPNPFNPVTTIEYSVPSRADVTIEIFNVLGQKVRTLMNETKSAGSYRIEWNGSDETGKFVSTGVYLYRFQAGEVVQTRKMLLIK